MTTNIETKVRLLNMNCINCKFITWYFINHETYCIHNVGKEPECVLKRLGSVFIDHVKEHDKPISKSDYIELSIKNAERFYDFDRNDASAEIYIEINSSIYDSAIQLYKWWEINNPKKVSIWDSCENFEEYE